MKIVFVQLKIILLTNYYYFQEENVVDHLNEIIHEAEYTHSKEFEFCLSENNQNPIQLTSPKISSKPSKRSNVIH